ncbi:MAG: hypothetical protein J5787_00295 [Alphaproteobacteria bacterium]|nr:hypothetical protein [Alphaproteobacteria bacterium]
MAENTIPRKYNYKLKTGAVGTNDNNMANILFSINKMETPTSIQSEEQAVMTGLVNDALTLLTDCKVFLDRFNTAHKDHIDQTLYQSVSDLYSAEQKRLMDAFILLTPPDQCAALLTDSYKNILATVPSLQKLDEQSIGNK